ncbi:MAG: hypothetical protein ACR2QH_10370 [Geminicoccaceae bacterium]
MFCIIGRPCFHLPPGASELCEIEHEEPELEPVGDDWSQIESEQKFNGEEGIFLPGDSVEMQINGASHNEDDGAELNVDPSAGGPDQ